MQKNFVLIIKYDNNFSFLCAYINTTLLLKKD
jgi:hypothetical protein